MFGINKKEKIILGIFFIFILILLIGIVSAQYRSYGAPGFQLTDIIYWLQDELGPFFAALFGVNQFDEFLFVKILMFFLIFSVANFALFYGDVFAGNRALLTMVSLIVALLSVRYMGDGAFIRALLVPYTAVGAVLTMGLPIIFFFLFVTVVVRGNYARRILWVLFGIAFWFSYYFTTNSTLTDSFGHGPAWYAGWMYSILGIFIIFNIIWPSWAARIFERMGIERAEENIYHERLAHLQGAYADAIRGGGQNSVTARTIHNEIERLVAQRGIFFRH